MAGYSARQSTFTTGDTITAAHSNNEFNAILAAFHVSTGHKHDGSTAGDGGPISTLFSNAISMGTGADTDIAVTFNANSNDGVITWMEDEDYFQFSDDLLLSTTEKIQFRDTAIYINSSTDGQLDLVADTEIQIAATTVDINGNVDISGSLTLGGTAITSTAAELNILDGVTSTTAELNILDGVTSTTAELNILDGVTSTAAELNILDGVTATATEINIIDGNTSATSTTVADADRVVYNDDGTMKQVAVTDLDTYISATSKTLTNKTLTSPVLNTGVSGTAILDEDNMSSNSATKLATQQSIKAYVDSEVGGVSSSWVLEDDDGTEVTVAAGKEVKFIGSGLTTNWTDTDNGTDGDPYDLTFTVDAAQTGITSLLATDIKIGEDNETKIDFETANEIHFYANNTEQVYLADNIFGPQSDSDVDLGTTSVRWKDAYIDSVTVTDNVTVGGDLTVNGTTTTVNSTTVTIDDPIFTLGGDSAPGSDDNKDRGIEFRWHNGSAAKVGFFGYDDSASAFTFIPDASNSSEVFSGTAGNVVFGNIAGTLTTAAQTNITSVGALDGGSISSNFGAIDVGSSAITTTGTVTGGTLAGTLSTAAQTNITSTGALDGGSITSGFGAIDNGTSGIRTNTFTAETSIVPDASGGADLGTTSLEWGDLYIADDKKIYLGSDQDVSIEYDEDGNNTTAVVAAGGISFAPHGTGTGNGTELRFQELAANGANYVGFKAPDSISSNEVWVLPNADGSANQVLKTDGSNALSWVDQAGGGEVSLVADGAISAQKPVILTSAGKAQQVAESVGSDISVAFTTMDDSDTVSSDGAAHMVYDSTSETFVAVYENAAGSDYPHAVAGTWSDGTITWGTPVVLQSVACNREIGIAVGNGKVWTAWARNVDTPNIYITSLSISGTAITVATPTDTSIAYSNELGIKLSYDISSNYLLLFNSNQSTGAWLFKVKPYYTTSGGGLTAGATSTIVTNGSVHANEFDVVYDPDTSRTVVVYTDDSNSNYGTANVIQSSGTTGSPTVTIGSDVVFSGTDAVDGLTATYDTANDKVFVGYHNTTDGITKGIIGTVTGGGTNSISFAGEGTINDYTAVSSSYLDVVYDSDASKIIVVYHDDDHASDGLTYRVITPGASSFSVSSAAVITTNENIIESGAAAFGAGKGTAVASRDSDNSQKLSISTLYYPLETNLDNGNYLGVAKAAISDTATGTIVIPGGISEGHSSLTIGNHYFTNGAGTIGLVGNTTGEQYVGRAISATEIQLLENEGYLYGTADGAITAGKPVQVKSDGDFQMISETTTSYSFAQGSSADVEQGTNTHGAIYYDDDLNKMVVINADSSPGGGMAKLTIFYGTITAGTTNSIAFDTGNVIADYTNLTISNIAASFDPVSKTTLVGVDRDNAGQAFAFTRSSTTSISHGTIGVTFYSGKPDGIDIVNVGENKWVIGYQQGSNYPAVKVATASGTTLSFGTEVVVNSSSSASGTTTSNAGFAMSYDTGSSQVVVFFRNSSGQIKAKVGTVSGTDISFGSAVPSSGTFTNGTQHYPHPGGAAYVPAKDVHIVAYDKNNDGLVTVLKTSGSGTDATLVDASGTAPGTSSFTVFDSSPSLKPNIFVAYESTPVIVYSDDSVDINSIAVSIDGTTPTMGTDRAIETTTSDDMQMGAYDPDTKRSVIIFKENSDGDMMAQVIAVEGSETTANMATDGESYLGIATKTVADNAQAEVATFGQIDAQQSGLTAGQKYFVQSDGSLATSADSSVPGYTGTVTTVAGKALSATKLLISE